MQPEGGFASGKQLQGAAGGQRDPWTLLPRPELFALQSSQQQPLQQSSVGGISPPRPLQDAARLPSLSGMSYPRDQSQLYAVSSAPRQPDMTSFAAPDAYVRTRTGYMQGNYAGTSPLASPEYSNFPKQPLQLPTHGLQGQSPYSPHGPDLSGSPAMRPWDLQQRRPLSEPPFRPFDPVARSGYESSALPSPIPSVRSVQRPGEGMSRVSSFQGFNEVVPQMQPNLPPASTLPYSRKRRSDSSEDEGEDSSNLVKWKQTHLDMLVGMKNEGSKWSDIALALNNGKSANACRKMYAKVIKDRDVWTPELDLALKQLYRQKREAFWTEIGQALNTNWHDVEARVIALGLGSVRHH